MYLYTRIAYDHRRINKKVLTTIKLEVKHSILFRVELITSSFLDLISKQARLNAALRASCLQTFLTNILAIVLVCLLFSMSSYSFIIMYHFMSAVHINKQLHLQYVTSLLVIK